MCQANLPEQLSCQGWQKFELTAIVNIVPGTRSWGPADQMSKLRFGSLAGWRTWPSSTSLLEQDPLLLVGISSRRRVNPVRPLCVWRPSKMADTEAKPAINGEETDAKVEVHLRPFCVYNPSVSMCHGRCPDQSTNPPVRRHGPGASCTS